MKNQLTISLVLVFGLTTIAQPSFAMKRNRPGNAADQLSSMISTIVVAVKWFLANELGPNHVTFVSQSGTNFNVPVNDLDAFLHLTPTIANMLDGLDASEISSIPLGHVSNPALYLLTQMASGADYESLLDYIRSLAADEIDRLRDEAQFLDSQALQEIISQALFNPFAAIPPELAHLIFAQIGPWGRSACRSVDKSFMDLIDTVRRAGCTDTLPIVATIPVGRRAQRPVVHGNMLYVANQDVHTVCVIDTNTNQVVVTIPVGRYPLEPVVHGHMLYVVNAGDSSVSVIDTNTNQVVTTILVGPHATAAFVQGQMLHVNTFQSQVWVINTSTNQVVHTIYGDAVLQLQAAYGPMLYVANQRDDTIDVINQNTSELVKIIDVGKQPQLPVLHGQMLYVANNDDGTVSVIDTNTNTVTATIEVGGAPLAPIVDDHMLYVVNTDDNTIYVIDIRGYLPGQL